MEPKTIVAIEIASSKIKGAVGSVNADGHLTVLAVEEIADTNNVRYGRVQNIREVSNVVNDIVRRLESSPNVYPRKIEKMSISIGGRSLSSAMVSASLRFPQECEISDSHLYALKEEVKRDYTGDKSVEAILPRAFYVNNALTRNPVGTFAETFKGDFMIITCGKETRLSLNRLKYDTVEKDAYELRPTAIADLVLSRDEKALGCALVDFGAETTTVSVYKDGTLAFLCTIPMGSRLITMDLMSGMGVTEETAESYKLTLGAGVGGDNSKYEEISEYVHARAGEIAANVAHQLECAGFGGGILNTIVLTGGGAKLPGFAGLLEAHCNKIGVKKATMPTTVSFASVGLNNDDNIDVVALLAAGARRRNWDCLSSLPIEHPEEHVKDETETEAAADNAQEDVWIHGGEDEVPFVINGKKDNEDDDSDTLLEDDPDEDDNTKASKRKKKRFSDIFSRSTKKAKEEAAPVDDEDYVDSGDTAEEPVEDTKQQKSPEEQAWTTIDNARNWITNLFVSNDEE